MEKNEKLNCPACKSETLQPFQVGSVVLQKCPKCSGLWFDGDELGQVEEFPETELTKDFQDQLDDASVTSAAGVKDAAAKPQEELCPFCEKPMLRYQYDLSSGIWIHGCPDGDGVWLDKGEVLKVHQHLLDAAKDLPPEKMQALMAQLKQIQQDEQKKEDQAVASLFGHHQGVGAPVWHLMDGICLFAYHAINKVGEEAEKLEEKM
jgi:Zn-finger nucleic acid-binding protein